MSYHLKDITKGTYGQLSKVQEELYEAIDAEDQGCKLMLLLELSDIVGAVEEVANRYGTSLDDLITMSNITKRAFNSGSRS